MTTITEKVPRTEHRADRLRTPEVLLGILLVLLCLFLGSGRTNNFDGASQLAQATHFCATGSVVAAQPLSEDFAPAGLGSVWTATRWYDSNDAGATLLLLPAACAGVLAGGGDPRSLTDLTTTAKGLASLTFAAVGGLTAAFVLLTLRCFMSLRRAWWWTLAFLFTTGTLAYLKGTWDILCAACAIAALCLIFARAYTRGHASTATIYGVALAVGLAGLCRFTTLPFLAIAAASAMLPLRKGLPARHVVGAALLVLILVLPELAFNQVRTGAFWKPGQVASQFGGRPRLDAEYVSTWPLMLFGFKRGLLFYAPVCLLGYAAVVLLAVRLTGARRLAALGCLAAAVLYLLTVVVSHEWRTFGWGPRYLLPLFPALFIAAVFAIERHLIPRLLGYAAVALGLVVNAPLLLANWHAVVSVIGRDERAPNSIVGLWHAAIEGVAHGRSFGPAEDPRALNVPDTWWWVAGGQSLPHPVGLLVLAIGVAAFVAVGTRLARAPSTPT